MFGVVLLVGGVFIAPRTLPVGPVLISAGGLVVLVGFALPLITEAQLGLPSIFTLTLAANARRDRLRAAIEDIRGMLSACAGFLCLDADAAAQAVQAAVADTLSRWQGSDDRQQLRRYLFCALLRQARFELRIRGPRTAPPAELANQVLALPLPEREVLVLVDRAGFDEYAAGQILSLSPAEVHQTYLRALVALGSPAGPA
jgi:DNA-directed RNA polymerase specialized sigma24 family protein